MDLRQLRLFVAVAEEGSVSAAADRVHVVQSAASATLRKLEAELGAELVARGARGVVLTDAGQALLPEARRTLAAVQAARDAVEGVRGGVRGTVRLGVMQASSGAGYSLPELLRAFRDSHPAVEVVIQHTGGSVQMAADVAAGRLDLAFVAVGEHDAPGVSLTALAQEPLDLVCSVRHPLAGRHSVRLPELAGEPFADVPTGWGFRIAADRAFAAAAVPRTVSVEVNDVTSVLEFVRHNLAVTLVPASFAGSDPELACVAIKPRAPVVRISLAAPADRPQSAAARALAAAISRGRWTQPREAVSGRADSRR